MLIIYRSILINLDIIIAIKEKICETMQNFSATGKKNISSLLTDFEKEKVMQFDDICSIYLHIFFNVRSTITLEQMFGFSYFFSWKDLFFPGGPVLNVVAIGHFKVCLFVLLNICLGHKTRKNLPNATKLGYVFDISNLRLCTKNCDFY